ncbi:MAG: hypothetical protein KC478_13805, partial [Bacteriovoracaceae bacterium]|nr:hypothetical protein [Bacteriovoracaceae bacterium]
MTKFIAGVLALSLSPCFAQSGFYSNFKTLIDIQDKNYTKKLESYAGNSKLKNLDALDSLDLDPDFVGSILFHTPSRYSSLGTLDSCSLYDLILSGLAKGPEGEIERFIVRYKTKDGKSETTVLNRKDFFEEVAFKRCPQVKKFQQYFNLKNVAKTLKTINLKTPTSEQACMQTHESFLKDHKTPYLCFLSEQVKSIPALSQKIKNTPKSDYREIQSLKRQLRVAKKYKSSLSAGGIEYLDSLCINLDKPKLFC